MDNLALAVSEALTILRQFKEDIISVSGIYTDIPEIHILNLTFFTHFSNYKLEYRDSDIYPIEAFEIVNGIKFFSIYNIEDFHHAN